MARHGDERFLLSDAEEEVLSHLQMQVKTKRVKGEAEPYSAACLPVVGADVGSDDMLMVEMQMDMMQNTDGLDMDEICMDINFHAVVHSGILGFYSHSASVNLVEPCVFKQIINEIDDAQRRLTLKIKKGPHPPTMGMNTVKKFCKKDVWSNDENRLLHVEFLRTKNKKSLSVTDLHHCVWFFDNKYKGKKGSKEKKDYIKKVQGRATHNERKVAMFKSDILHYCTGRYKLPRSLMEKPILVLKNTAFDKASKEVPTKPRPKSRKHKLEAVPQKVKRAKYQFCAL